MSNKKVGKKEIEDKLGCKFIRVSDRNNLFYNIGLVIREIGLYFNPRKELADVA